MLLAVLCTAGTWFWFWSSPSLTVPYKAHTAAQERTAAAFLVAAMGCGLVVPVVGALISVRTGRRLGAAFFMLVLVAVATVGVRLEILTPTGLRGVYHEIVPAKPAPTSTHCREYSGDGNECPGG